MPQLQLAPFQHAPVSKPEMGKKFDAVEEAIPRLYTQIQGKMNRIEDLVNRLGFSVEEVKSRVNISTMR